MKAAVIQQPGPPENIQYVDLPMPAIGEREVLVQVRAVTVNPVDTYIRSGKYKIDLPLPFIVGRDMVGVVEKTNSARFKAGQRVWCNNQGYAGRQGTFAEYLAIREDLLYPLPDGVDEQSALLVLHAALTAAVGLFQKANIKSGETLFLRGGSGNVGTVVLSVAKAQGAKVAVTAGSDEDIRHCQELGADRIINYKTENIETALREFAPQGLDIFWDLTQVPEIEPAVNVLAHRGRVIFMAGMAQRCTLPVGPFYNKNCTLYGYTITNATVDELRDCAERINDWLARKILVGRVAEVMPLSQAAEAHRKQEQWPTGKIVLVP